MVACAWVGRADPTRIATPRGVVARKEAFFDLMFDTRQTWLRLMKHHKDLSVPCRSRSSPSVTLMLIYVGGVRKVTEFFCDAKISTKNFRQPTYCQKRLFA